MAAWAPSTNVNPTDLDFFVGRVGGAALSNDADPNSAPPDGSRVFYLPEDVPGDAYQKLLQVFCSGGTCTVVGWVHSADVGRWIKIFTQALAAADTFYAIGVGIIPAQGNTSNSYAIPDGFPIFLQVTSNSGATIVGAIVH